jgi:MinD-like ATPase involved in chromosome partitioning or flagellar assembly
MTSVAAVSVGGAPGVTTLLCAAAAAAAEDRPVLVVEASPSGGTIAARWRLNVRDTVATTAKLAMDLAGSVDLWDVAHRPWLGNSRVIPAHPSAVVMRQAQVGQWLASRVSSAGKPMLIDAGRIDGTADQLALLESVDVVWLVVDPIVEQVAAAKAAASWLNRVGRVEVVVREPAGDPARESATAVARALEWPAAATVPDDLASARALCGLSPPRRGLSRSPLLRTGRALAERLTVAGVPA